MRMKEKKEFLKLCGMGLVLFWGGFACGGGSSTTTSADVCNIRQLNNTASDSVAIGSTLLNGNTVIQSFFVPAGSDQSFSKVKIGLVREGYPIGRLTLKVQTDNSDSPSGVEVSTATSVNLDYTSDSALNTSTFKTTHEWYTFSFGSSVTFTQNKRYWLVLTTSAALNATTYVMWTGVNTNPYTSGRAMYLAGSLAGANYSTAAITDDRDLTFAMCQ
jgi:hypothetical protein